MKHLKSLHLQSPWTIQSALDRTGRRVLTIANKSVRKLARRQVIGRPGDVLRLSVQSKPEEWSGFEPVIRVRS